MFTVMAFYEKGCEFGSSRCHYARTKNISCFTDSFRNLLLNMVRSVAKFQFQKQQSSTIFTIQIMYTSSASVYFFCVFRVVGGIAINSCNFVTT